MDPKEILFRVHITRSFSLDDQIVFYTIHPLHHRYERVEIVIQAQHLSRRREVITLITMLITGGIRIFFFIQPSHVNGFSPAIRTLTPRTRFSLQRLRIPPEKPLLSLSPPPSLGGGKRPRQKGENNSRNRYSAYPVYMHTCTSRVCSADSLLAGF